MKYTNSQMKAIAKHIGFKGNLKQLAMELEQNKNTVTL
jgi:hypothetical protein